MMAEDPKIVDDEPVEGRRSRLLSKLARRIRNPGELGEDAMFLVSTVLESSDRAKTEMVRMVAREVRTYLEELKVDEGLRSLVTGHSLEVHLSLSLKPLGDHDDDEQGEDVDEEPGTAMVPAEPGEG